MSRTATSPRRDRPVSETLDRPGRRLSMPALVAVGISVVAVAVALLGSGDGGDPAAVGPMGGELVDVEMTRDGTAAAGGVEVIGSTVEMGVVPLDVTVVPSWTLTNTGDEPVELGRPHASVLEGCCPGPLVLGTPVLGPGESTELTFPLQMHAGMDGPHHFAVHVPVGNGDQVLELHTTGDFRS